MSFSAAASALLTISGIIADVTDDEIKFQRNGQEQTMKMKRLWFSGRNKRGEPEYHKVTIATDRGNSEPTITMELLRAIDNGLPVQIEVSVSAYKDEPRLDFVRLLNAEQLRNASTVPPKQAAPKAA